MNGKGPFFVLCAVIGLAIGWWWTSGRPLPDLDWPVTRQDTTSDTSGNLHTPPTGSGTSQSATADSAGAGNAAQQAYSGMPSTAVVSYYDGIMKVAPSVVSLYASASPGKAATSTGELNAVSQGSGVIVNADGVVLTNLHLVEGLDRITVVLSDGRSYPALLIGSDRETDLAVVRIAASNLPFVPLDDAPPLRVGDVVLAIGNPFGVGQTVTQGIVSATRRRIAGGSVWQHFVQIDAAINPGNSGGALINPFGQLVGVNTAVFRGDSGAVGIGFAIPADLLAQVVPQIIEHGSVARGWLGIWVDELSLSPELARRIGQGAMIVRVLENSPASHGELQEMDVITAINGQPVSSATQLLLAISMEPPGTSVSLSIVRVQAVGKRAGSTQDFELKTREITLELGVRPDLSTVARPR